MSTFPSDSVIEKCRKPEENTKQKINTHNVDKLFIDTGIFVPKSTEKTQKKKLEIHDNRGKNVFKGKNAPNLFALYFDCFGVVS